VRLLASSQRLPAVKRNEALREARGDLVIFMNDDVWVTPMFVREHVASHRRAGRPVAVIGRCDQSTRMPRDPFTAWFVPFSYHEIDDRADDTVSYWFSWSMNMSFPRATMLDRNLVFHEEWVHIGEEDIELGYRWTVKAGYDIVYNPRAWGEHFHIHTLDSACRVQESIGRGLRDLEALVPEPDLLERFGVLTPDASPRGRIRMTARRALFNRYTVPPLQRHLGARSRRSRIAEWSYWKILLHHTEVGYRSEPPRSPAPTPLREPSRV
jgi:GT2 family glycosyltransferase